MMAVGVRGRLASPEIPLFWLVTATFVAVTGQKELILEGRSPSGTLWVTSPWGRGRFASPSPRVGEGEADGGNAPRRVSLVMVTIVPGVGVPLK